MGCRPDWRELGIGVPRFIGPLNVHRTSANPILGYSLLAVAFFVRNPAGDAFVVVTSLWNLNVSTPLVIAPPAESVVEPPLASVRLPVDYDVLAPLRLPRFRAGVCSGINSPGSTNSSLNARAPLDAMTSERDTTVVAPLFWSTSVIEDLVSSPR